MYVKLEMADEHQRSGRSTVCAVCGVRFFFGGVLAYAYSDGGMDFGPVCPTCLAGGPEGIAQQLEAHAALLRCEVDEVEKIAAEDIVAPTIEDLQLMEKIVAL